MKHFLFFFIIVILLAGCTDRNDEDNASLEAKGDFAFDRREYLNASDIWGKALLKNPKNLSLTNKLGDCYLKLGRLERAKLFFKKAVEIDPDNINIQLKLAQVYILTGNLSEADKIAEILEKKKDRHPELDLLRADLCLITNQPDKAENFYRKAIIGSKESLRALMKLAIFLKSLKSIDKQKEADEILKIVEKNTIASFQIYLLLADYYLLDNRYDKAEKSILEAIRLEPEDNSLKCHLVQFYIAAQNNSKAETTLENMLENLDDIYLRMMLSDVYISNNKLQKAENIILKLKAEINESSIEFELLQGKFWLYSGKPVYATSHLESALELRPGLVNARYLLGLTHLLNEKIKLSENSLTRTLQIYPNHYKALLLISELLYKRKEYSLSLKYLDRFLENYPEDFTGHIIKGLNLLGQNEYALAKKEFDKSIHLSDRTYLSYYYSGLTEELMGNGITALMYYRQVLDVYPDLIDASYRYCMLLAKMKQKKTARDFINKKLAETNKSPELYYLAAKVALEMGERSRGEAFLKNAIQLDYVPGFIYMELADFYKNNHDIKNAIKTLDQCIKRLPSFPDAWLALSNLYVVNQDLTTALEILQEGYKKFQDVPIFQSNLAWLLLEDDPQTNEALSLAQSAYEKMPDNIAFADTLGWAYYHKRVYSQAIWLLSEAEKKAPQNGFIQYHLGMAYYKQGEIEKAFSHLKIAGKSEESIYFSHEIATAMAELSRAGKDNSHLKISSDKESILSPPEKDHTDDTEIIPQWKQ